MGVLQKIADGCDALNEWLGSWIVSGIVFVFVGIVFTNVIMRYVFNSSWVFMAELEWHLFALIFLLGAGYTLLHDRHVRVDIFYSQMGPKQRAMVNLLGVLVLLVPSCLLVLKTSIPWVISSYQVAETSIDPGGIPARFLLKAMLPLGYLLLFLQGISLGINSLGILLGREERTKD